MRSNPFTPPHSREKAEKYAREVERRERKIEEKRRRLQQQSEDVDFPILLEAGQKFGAMLLQSVLPKSAMSPLFQTGRIRFTSKAGLLLLGPASRELQSLVQSILDNGRPDLRTILVKLSNEGIYFQVGDRKYNRPPEVSKAHARLPVDELVLPSSAYLEPKDSPPQWMRKNPMAQKFPVKTKSGKTVYWTARQIATMGKSMLAPGQAKMNPTPIKALVARRNMAGRPGKYGLPRIPPADFELAHLPAADLKALGTKAAKAELARRKASRGLRVGVDVPERVAKRPVRPAAASSAMGDATTARFPGVCPVCHGEITRGEAIVDTGIRGPKGGKKMVHVRCAR